jgi:hypothetical protein
MTVVPVADRLTADEYLALPVTRFDLSLELERSEALSSPLLDGFELRIDELFPPEE